MPDPIKLNGRQRNQLQALVDDPHLAPAFALRGPDNPNVRVFMANFDGTYNDKDKVPRGEFKTLVGLMHEEALNHASDTFQSHYAVGVGMGKGIGLRRHYYEGVTGDGCELRAEIMHAKLAEAALAWKIENPDAIVHVCATGFSRGSASAMHFLNLVDQRGATPGDALRSDADWCLKMGIGPGQLKSSALLLDMVATGQEKTLLLSPPKTLVASLHLLAAGEERTLFKAYQITDSRYKSSGDRHGGLNNHEWAQAKNVLLPKASQNPTLPVVAKDGSFFYQRIKESSVAGARHSDVGGSYKKDGMARVPGYLANCFLQSLGIPVKTPVKPQMEAIQRAEATDSRWDYTLYIEELERIFGKESSRQNVSRLTVEKGDRPWEGTILRTVHISVFDENDKQVDKRSLQMVVPHDPEKTVPDGKSLAKEKTTTFNIAESPPQKSNAIGFDINHKKKTIEFDGLRIDDMNEANPLSNVIFNKTPNRKVVFKIVEEKIFCALHNGKQNIKPGQSMDVEVGRETWSPLIGKALKMLNTREGMDPSEESRLLTPLVQSTASYLVGKMMKESSHALMQETPGIESVTFKVIEQDQAMGESKRPLRIVATIVENGETHVYPKRDVSKNPKDLAMRQSLVDVMRGMTEVCQMLHQQGMTAIGLEMETNQDPAEKKKTRPRL